MEYIKFSNFITKTQYGYTAEETSIDEGDVKYLRITDIVPYFVDKDRVPYCKISDNKKKQYLVEKDDLLIARTGATTGYNLIVPKGFDNYIFASYLVRYYYRKEVLFPQYLKYVLKSKHYYGFVNNYIGGSAQPGMNPKSFGRFEVPYVDYENQKRIASVLYVYDSLIENNNKRIKVLEQMAENLYKEWFVRFRFPGHENTEYENGIPKGWKICRFSSIANILSGGTPKTEHEEYYGGQIPFYTPKDSSENFFVFDTITKLTEDGLRHCNSQLYPQNTIMITARGTVGNLNLLAVPMAMNQSCYALNSDTISSQYFLFFLIKREIQKIKKMASGGVFDTIIVNTFDHIKVLLPTDELINKFDLIVSSIMKEVYSLSKQNINLIKQRDILLPRLMSGKLEVKV